jgi:single-stranded DNA-binding protein
VYVEGKISTRKWTKDGIDRYVTEIRAETIRVLNKVEGSKEAEVGAISTHASDMLNSMDDEVPF